MVIEQNASKPIITISALLNNFFKMLVTIPNANNIKKYLALLLNNPIILQNKYKNCTAAIHTAVMKS